MALPSLDFDAELVLCRCCSREAGAIWGRGSARNHYRVGCSGRHFRKPGRQKPSGGAEGKVTERVEAVKRSWSEEVRIVEWFSLEYRKEVHEKIHRHF